ncbi:MAG: hypothetical protein COS88_01090 [Chloroflexi bacterium CG07_land_8_20_14_0_80_51_10]|nr:MAG: hypothetical protein COS88_01090 [Chloroflexi bacterium CG07_land_8_20_14_0_80_51_10]
MVELATDYTLEEQLVCQLAREFGPDDNVVAAGMLNYTFVAVALAQRLYAPQLGFYMDAGVTKGKGTLMSGVRYPFAAGRPPEDFVDSLLTSEEIFAFLLAGKWNIFMQPVQVDKFGNTNLSLVGDMKKPTRVFVGSRGLPDNTTNAGRTYFTVPNHSARVFVEKIDFISGVGYGPERRQGNVKYGAPRKIFTNLCVLDIDEKTKQLRLHSVHKGVTVDQVKGNTSFELIMPKSVPETDPPTQEEIKLLREIIDPAGIRRLDHLKGDELKRVFGEISKGTTYDLIYS